MTLLAVGATVARGQALNYTAARAQNLPGTYADLGTTGTPISTPNNDDANSAATPIGFSFSFNGTTFTDFVLNTNGYLALGTTAPAAPFFSVGAQDYTGGPIQDTKQTNLLLPFNVDLTDATSTPAEYRVATTGAPGRRVCTIQWKNVKDKPQAPTGSSTAVVGTQYDNFAFQVRLYETSNKVEFAYNSAIAGAGPDAFKYITVGVKGSGNAAGQLILATKSSTSAWAAATFLGGDYTTGIGNAFNIRSTARPDAGRTFRFQPTFVRDAEVQTIYTLGKLPVPLATPHVMQAVVRNVGSAAITNVSVTASVPAPNAYSSTKTIASLAVGASTLVTFDPYSPTTPTTQTVTVTLSDDDNTTDDINNNVNTYQQQVNTTTFAYAEPGVGPSGTIGFGANSGILAIKCTTNTARSLTAVNVRLEDANTIGKTVYAVITNTAGTIIARSADYVVVAADISTYHNFLLTSPLYFTGGDFFAGMTQTTGSAAYAPFAFQSEIPTRAGAYFSIPVGGGTPFDLAGSNTIRPMIEAVTSDPPTCLPPTGITVTGTTGTTATFTFAGPTNGTGYTVIYGPNGFNPATSGMSVTGAGSPFTLTGLNSSTNYQFYIRANCGATDQSILSGPYAFSTQCVASTVAAFPYAENFDGALALPCGYTVNDANSDGKTWTVVASNPASAPNAIRYSYSTANNADDWFFTPALTLRAGSRYQLQFKYRSSFTGTFQERLEVKYGSSATPAAMTTALFQNTAISNAAYTTTTAGTGATDVAPIVPGATGNVFIGFHAISAVNSFYLYVDDINITAVTGTSAALDRSISVFPNPSTGIVTLDIRGANARGAMQVEVTNLLGQVIHSALVHDNELNTLDLSALAGGLYTLKIKSGNDFSVRQLMIQK